MMQLLMYNMPSLQNMALEARYSAVYQRLLTGTVEVVWWGEEQLRPPGL